MVMLCGTPEIKVSVSFLAGSQNASLSRASFAGSGVNLKDSIMYAIWSDPPKTGHFKLGRFGIFAVG